MTAPRPVNTYRLHLATGDRLMLRTAVDLVTPLRTGADVRPAWIDCGDNGLVNPDHVVRIEVL